MEGKGLTIQPALAMITSPLLQAGAVEGSTAALRKNVLTNPHNDKGSHTVEYSQVLDAKHHVVQEQGHQAA